MPPDLEALRRQIEADRAIRHANRIQQWEDFIHNQLLPRVNAALYSERSVSYRVGKFIVQGSREDVRIICPHQKDVVWVACLINVIRVHPAYSDYMVGFYGVKTIGSSEEYTTLKRHDLFRVAKEFLDSSPMATHFEVRIGP